MLKEISIEITRKCPNRCLHCSSLSGIEYNEAISLEKFNDVIQRGKEIGLKTVCLSGGEPFIHDDIIQIIDSAYDQKLNVIVYTSGIIFDAEGKYCSLSDQICKKISSKVNKLIFNLESTIPNAYDEIMGTKNCFPLLLESIKNARKHNICVEFHFVPMKLNHLDIDNVINLGIELGVEKISFLRLVSHGRAEENSMKLQLNDNDFEVLRLKLVEIKEKYGDLIRIGVPLSNNECDHKCEAAKGKLNIRYDGKVFPCEVFKNKQFEECYSDEQNSIYKDNLVHLYNENEYLKSVRFNIDVYSDEKCKEKCYGQYLINKFSSDRKE